MSPRRRVPYGEPVKIADLARDLIELSGLEMGRDIDIAFTGLRPGEKLFEELFIPGEVYARTAHQKIFVARNGGAEAAGGMGLDAGVDHMIAAAECGDRTAIVQALREVVPEYQVTGRRGDGETGRRARLLTAGRRWPRFFGGARLGWLAGQPLVGMVGQLLAASSLSFAVATGRRRTTSWGMSAARSGLHLCKRQENVSKSQGIFLACLASWREILGSGLSGSGYRRCTVTRLYSGLAAAGGMLALAWTLDAPGNGLAIGLSLPLLCRGLGVLVWRQERARKPL